MVQDYSALRRAVETGFGRGRVLVVGDILLDKYFWGDVGRVSPEAPVLIVRLVEQTDNPGGAGNVMLNLAQIGLSVAAVGFVGNDPSGGRLLERLGAAGVDVGGVVRWEDRPTITKTRVVGGHQQIVRLDEEDLRPAPPSSLQQLQARIDEAFERGVDAVILSDYAKGALPESVCQAVIGRARALDVPVIVDPKGRDFRKYRGATTLTPNRAEFNAAAASHEDAGFVEAAQRLLDELALDFLVVTQAERGISLIDGRGGHHSPALAREVFDVSGAGDTVIALLTAGLVAGLEFGDVLHLANLAAGVVVGKVGTVPVRADELLDAIDATQAIERSGKITDLPALLRTVARWRAKGECVVFTNGCFDLLHAGHIKLIERARAEGTRLIVGLNSDRSVRQLKGSTRPVIPEGDRMQVLAALGSVDAVILFEEETPLRLIEAIRPDVLVKGGDYEDHQVVGGDVVRASGGKVVLIPLVEGRSTTRIVSKLKIAAGA